ncbi:hypothetical protein D3C87_1434890 [compost metagenome]
MPEIARITKEMATAQCTKRSVGVKRSIIRPVRGDFSGMVRRQAKKARMAAGARIRIQPPQTVSTPLRNSRHCWPVRWIRTPASLSGRLL